MSIKFDTFKAGGGGAGTDNLDDVTTRGATTTNAITVGGVTIGTEYSLPAADGSSNQYLKTDGAGTLSFAALDVTGGLVYQGAFNATAGTPSIANAEKGDFYVIDTAGSLYGQDWNVGDHLLINEDMGGIITNSKIDKIDNTETPASETVAGVIEIATNLEAQGATVNNKALVPSNISSIALSSFNDDLSYLSSGDNVSLLTNDAGYLTSVSSASETVEGIIETATNLEAQGASVNNKALVPSNISSIALSSFNDDLSYLSSGDNVSLLTNDSGYLTDITGENLGDLSDVTISSVVNAQVLQYDSGSSAWINATISTGGGSVPNLTSISSSQTTDYTISSTTGIEEIYIIDPGAAINVNLPAAATAGSGYKYNIKNISGTYSLTIDPNSTETIDGVSTYSLNVQYQSVTIVSDGSNWFII